jgi:hypothetical protein
MRYVRFLLAVQALLIPALSGPRAAAADFPPVTDEERALTSVPGEPNAPAVVLFRRGEFLMAGYGLGGGSLASALSIQVRLKILTEEGKSNGEISIGHSDAHRLKGFQGRTVLPDGRVIPVPSDAKFVRKTSRSQKTFTTAVAFPSVQVGAILDYRYVLRFDSIFRPARSPAQGLPASRPKPSSGSSATRSFPAPLSASWPTGIPRWRRSSPTARPAAPRRRSSSRRCSRRSRSARGWCGPRTAARAPSIRAVPLVAQPFTSRLRLRCGPGESP